MNKYVLLFGFILGLILCINLLYTISICYNNPTVQSNDILGYGAMIVAFSTTFFGILIYRNKELNGEISFEKAFKTGALIVLVGSTLYVVVWLFYYYLFVPDFIDKYIPHVLAKAASGGATSEELAAKSIEMIHFKELYKNPLLVVLFTYMEVLPLGLLVTLVSALMLKKKVN